MPHENIIIESRLTKVETQAFAIHDEIYEIKKSLRWLTGIVFGLNSTIIGLLAKGFNLL